LLNVGPTGEGLVPPESIERLQGLGRWMRIHGDAIYGTEASPFEAAPFRATRKGTRVNCFLPEWPAYHELLLPNLPTPITRARLMGVANQAGLPIRRADRGTIVTLPNTPSDQVCSVLALEL